MERILRVFDKPAVRIIEALLALFFVYLAAVKLLDSEEIAHLTAIGVSPGRRITVAIVQLVVGALLIVGASGLVTAPMVIAVAATEVFVFQRPPLIAAMCVGTHGFTTWLRHAHDSTPGVAPTGDESIRKVIEECPTLPPEASTAADSNASRPLGIVDR